MSSNQATSTREEANPPVDLDDLSFFPHKEEVPMGGNSDGLRVSAPIPNFYRITSRSVEEATSQQEERTSAGKLIAYPDIVVDNERSALLPSNTYSERGDNFTEENYTKKTAFQDVTFPRVLGDINSNRSSNLRNTLPQIVVRIRVMNLIITSCTIVCMILTLWLKILNVTKLILSVYCIIGSIILCLYELHLSSTQPFIEEKFGLLFSPHGRATFIIFLGSLCLTQGLFPFFFGLCLIFNGCYIYHAICRYPDYVMMDKSLANRRDIRDVASQKVGEWTVPAWARPLRTTGGATGEDMAYGAVTSTSGDTSLFSGVREVVDEDQQKLLDSKKNFQEVKSLASAALGKLNFDACLPKRKNDKKEFRVDDDEIEYDENHIDRTSFIH